MQISVGKPVMTTADIVFIKTVVKGLQDSGINIASMTLPVGASELYVRPSGVPYTIKFALNGDVRQQVGDYLAVKNYVGDTPPQEYIDVRVGERAFVK